MKFLTRFNRMYWGRCHVPSTLFVGSLWLGFAMYVIIMVTFFPVHKAEAYVSYHRHPGQNGYSDTVHAHEGGNISHRH